MTDNKSQQSPADLTRIFAVRHFFVLLRRMLWVWTYVIPFVFLVLKISVPDLVNQSKPSFVLEGAVFLWYLSWAFGLGTDIKVQEQVYYSDPHLGRMPTEVYIIFAVMLLFAVALLMFVDQARYLALALTAFSIASIIGFWKYRQRAYKIIEASRSEYCAQQDTVRIRQIDCLDDYIRGRWNEVRATILLLMLVPVDVLCWNSAARGLLTEVTLAVYGTINPSALDALIPTLAVVVFLAFGEIWQWKRRLKVKFYVAILEELRNTLQ